MKKFVLNKDEKLVIDETKNMIRKLILTNSFSNYDMISVSLMLYALEKMPLPAENVKVSMKISTKKKKFKDYQSLNLNTSNEIVSLNLTNHTEDKHSFKNQSEELYSLILGGQFNTSCSLSKIKKAIKFFTEEYTEIFFYNYNK